MWWRFMKTARLQVLTTPAFRDWLRKEARDAGVSVAELVRTRCERKPTGEEQAVAKLASHLHKEVRNAPSANGGALPPAADECSDPMSVLTQAIDAIKEALKLTDEVRRAGETLKDLAQEIRDHDRRITRLEAQWETAAMLSRRRLE
jgi:hypothetical protein